MEEEDAMNGEQGNTEEKADDDEKEVDTEDNSKTTITTKEGRKGKGVESEVNVPNGQENPIK